MLRPGGRAEQQRMSSTTRRRALRLRDGSRAVLTTFAAGGIAAIVLVSACTHHVETPDAQVRALLTRAEAAAEAKDIATLKQLIAADYRDEAGQDKRALTALLVYTFMQHESIHLLTRVHAIAFPQPARAEVSAFVAMAGQAVDSVNILAGLSADLYRFDFILTDHNEGHWQVVRAEWHPATLDDFQ